MAPLLNVNLEANNDGNFLLCTFRVPINRTSLFCEVFNGNETKFLENDIIKDELWKFLFSMKKECLVNCSNKNNQNKRERNQYYWKTLFDNPTMQTKREGDEVRLETVGGGNEQTVTSAFKAKEGKQGNYEYQCDTITAQTLYESELKTKIDDSDMLKKESEQVRGPSVLKDDLSCELSGKHCFEIVGNTPRTWWLNQQSKKRDDTSVPVNDNNSVGVDFMEDDNSVLSSQGLESFVDFSELLSFENMRTPISTPCQNTDLRVSDNLSSYDNFCLSPITSDVESSLEDLVKDLESDSSQDAINGIDNMECDLEKMQAGKDVQDFQAFLSALLDPREECSAGKIPLNIEETNVNLNFTSTGSIDESPETINSYRCYQWPGINKNSYEEVLQMDKGPDRQEKKAGGARKKPNQCYHLWDFLRDELRRKNDYLEWVNEETKEFRILDTKKIATAWGSIKKSQNMNYDKLSRSLRYYCKLRILEKVPGKRLYFKFGDGKMWSKI